MHDIIEEDFIDEELIKQAIAYTIKEKRLNYPGHMSQGKLADKAKVSINTVVAIEKARMCPTFTMILRLSHSLRYENEFDIFNYIEQKYKSLKALSDSDEYFELHGDDFKALKINSKKKKTIV